MMNPRHADPSTSSVGLAKESEILRWGFFSTMLKGLTFTYETTVLRLFSPILFSGEDSSEVLAASGPEFTPDLLIAPCWTTVYICMLD